MVLLLVGVACAPTLDFSGKSCASSSDCADGLLCSRGVCKVNTCAGTNGQLSAIGEPACGVWLGAYPSTKNNDWPGEVTNLDTIAGRKLDLVRRFGGIADVFPEDDTLAVGKQGRLLSLALAPRNLQNTTQCKFADIASGVWDPQLQSFATRVASLAPLPVFVDYAGSPDTVIPGNGTASEYVAAYRHVHDYVRSQGASNVVWVWRVSGNASDESLDLATYPGDDVVDWVAYEGYNAYKCNASGAAWLDLGRAIEPFSLWLDAQSFHGKPRMLSALASVEDPADATHKPDWLASLPAVLDVLPLIKAVSFFSSGGPGNGSGSCSNRLDSSTATSAEFHALMAMPRFAPPFP